MSEYRLHIDIALGTGEADAVLVASRLISTLSTHVRDRAKIESIITSFNYRLGHDDDRQKSNYLLMNENGHVDNKKIHIVFNHLDR